jgi:hypothetical protein
MKKIRRIFEQIGTAGARACHQNETRIEKLNLKEKEDDI